MSLDLDTRQRAMLREMDVHVWLPSAPEAFAEMAGDVDGATESVATHAGSTWARGQNNSQEAQPGPAGASPPPAAGQAASPEAGAEAMVQADHTPAMAVPTPTAAAPSATPRPTASGRRPALPTPDNAPTTVTDLPAGIATMAWPEVQHAVAHCQGCAMCFGRRAPVLAAPDQPTPCDWLVVGDPPDEMEERAGQPFVDDVGLLFDNMLRAVGVRRWVPDAVPEGESGASAASASAHRAYLTHVLKCRPALMRAPDAVELATCAHYLRREIALTQPKVILAMGRFAMQVLLSETPPESARLPLGKLRGQVWQFAGVPVVVTYPPAYLLRSGQDKGKAWADLCLALDVAQGQLPAPTN